MIKKLFEQIGTGGVLQLVLGLLIAFAIVFLVTDQVFHQPKRDFRDSFGIEYPRSWAEKMAAKPVVLGRLIYLRQQVQTLQEKVNKDLSEADKLGWASVQAQEIRMRFYSSIEEDHRAVQEMVSKLEKCERVAECSGVVSWFEVNYPK